MHSLLLIAERIPVEIPTGFISVEYRYKFSNTELQYLLCAPVAADIPHLEM
jgi:hypothetical protein